MLTSFMHSTKFQINQLTLTLFDMGGHDDPQNVFSRCAQMLRRKKLKLGDF